MKTSFIGATLAKKNEEILKMESIRYYKEASLWLQGFLRRLPTRIPGWSSKVSRYKKRRNAFLVWGDAFQKLWEPMAHHHHHHAYSALLNILLGACSAHLIPNTHFYYSDFYRISWARALDSKKNMHPVIFVSSWGTKRNVCSSSEFGERYIHFARRLSAAAL